MAKKKTYYIPTIEVITLGSGALMQEWLAGSGEHGAGGYGDHAPKRQRTEVF